mmetsp:Transcript_9954/g.13648  ORF Transcript_9954/g.13648 Transcript_9954/m.13648 type:complete len:149 (+) Transcript_9954:423-869(+)
MDISTALSSKFSLTSTTTRLLSLNRPNLTHTCQSFEPYFKESLPIPESSSQFNSTSQKKMSTSSKGKSSKLEPVTLGPAFCLQRQLTKLCSDCWDAYCGPRCKVSRPCIMWAVFFYTAPSTMRKLALANGFVFVPASTTPLILVLKTL